MYLLGAVMCSVHYLIYGQILLNMMNGLPKTRMGLYPEIRALDPCTPNYARLEAIYEYLTGGSYTGRSVGSNKTLTCLMLR